MIQNIYQITEIKPGIFLVNESCLSSFYIILGSKRALIIDSGTGIGNPQILLAPLLQNLPYQVVLTHGHVDHAGGIGAFHEVYIMPADFHMALAVDGSARLDYAKKMIDVGVAPINNCQLELIPHFDTPTIKCLYCQNFDLGNRFLTVIPVPGHTDGSVCLWDAKDNILFSGDSFNSMQLLDYHPQGRQIRLGEWLHAAQDCLSLCSSDTMLCAGHAILSMSQAQQTLMCGQKAYDGEIPFVFEKRHIFYTEFATYHDSCLCYGSFDQISVN